jgi:chemotaxis-related protein WspD
VCPANEVHGVYRIRAGELQDVPLTLRRAVTRHSRAVLSWQGRSVGVLDEEALFTALQQGLA